MKIRSLGSFMLGGALLLLAACPVESQEKNTIIVPRQLPGDGIADPAGKIGFFPNPTGGIDAINLSTGAVLWASKDANRPLLATENRLFAQRQTSVFVLDTADKGKRVLEARPIALPNWVSVEPAYGRSFRGNAWLDGDAFLLSWDARAFYAGGARPTPEIEKAARKEASGVARIDLQSGKIESLDADQIRALKAAPKGNILQGKVGTLTLSIVDERPKMPKNPFEMIRKVVARNEMKEIVWQREIAPPPFLPPRP